MKKARSELEVYIEILTILKKNRIWIAKSRLMSKANLCSQAINRYIQKLSIDNTIEKNIKITEFKEMTKVKITEKGIKRLAELKSLSIENNRLLNNL